MSPIQTSYPQFIPMMSSASLDVDTDQNPVLQPPVSFNISWPVLRFFPHSFVV